MLGNVRKNLIAAVAVAAMSCAISSPAKAGMPVIDIANLAQAIQQVISWGQQLQAMSAHLQQLQQTYQSLTGPRGMQNLLPITTGARNYLPTDYSELMNVINGTSTTYAGLAGQVQGIIQNNAVLTNGQTANLSPRALQLLTQGRQSAAALAMVSQQTQANASSNFGSLQGLIAALGLTSDTKASADLQGRIQSEQVMTTTNQIKTDAMYQTINAQELQRQQQTREAVVASLGNFTTRFQPAMNW
jgi:type IV secretion system protein VirB5